ncbi:peptidase inhibitor family I36 protein [Kitasatospora sp. NPDC003701]
MSLEATLYTDAEYQGKQASLGPGHHVLEDNVDNQISSLRVPSGLRVTLFNRDDFTGPSSLFTSDTAKLPADINDRASSVTVEEVGKRLGLTRFPFTFSLPRKG